jgi:hypothetical protein
VRELIYDEVVAAAGFDPEKDVGERWSLKAAKHRLHLSDHSSTGAVDKSWRLEDLLGDPSARAAAWEAVTRGQ